MAPTRVLLLLLALVSIVHIEVIQSNSTLLTCDNQKMRDHERLYLRDGETVELTCDNLGTENKSLQWAYDREGELILIDDETPPGNKHQLVKNNSSLLLTVSQRSEDNKYFCLEKQQHRCHLLSRFSVSVPPEVILRSVGESLELNCSDGDGTQTHQWRMNNALGSGTESLNSTLTFPSLTVDHSGSYTCELSVSDDEDYYLFVCPESAPPAMEPFTVGESLTLRCGDWNQIRYVLWFMRSNRTGGQVVNANDYRRPGNMHLSNTSLVIEDVSLLDSGEFWCVVMKGLHCVFRSETLVVLREPEFDHLLLRLVQLSVVILMMLCVVVGVLAWRSRIKEQLPAPVEEQEMAQLSPPVEEQEMVQLSPESDLYDHVGAL